MLGMVLFLKLILALCSIAYELVLAQSMSAFLENTVLRYSVTIGLYLFAMGLGAFFIDRRMTRPLQCLWNTEIALTIVGALSVPSLFLVDHLFGSRLGLLVWGHALIIAIGFLTGFELPLLLKIAQDKQAPSRNKLIAFDYAGAFAGSLLFVFLLYPHVGLVPSVIAIAFVNAAAGLGLLKLWPAEEGRPRYVAAVQLLVLGVAAALLAASPLLETVLVRLYLGGV